MTPIPAVVTALAVLLALLSPHRPATPTATGRGQAAAPPAPTPPAARTVRGTASWYRWHPGEAAAGPALRAALGPSWRGTTVLVCGMSSCTRVALSDWCQCRGTRLVDLDARSFARLADPARGLVPVTVEVP